MGKNVAAIMLASVLISTSAYADIRYCATADGQVVIRSSGAAPFVFVKGINAAVVKQPFPTLDLIEVDLIYKNRAQDTYIVTGHDQVEFHNFSVQDPAFDVAKCPGYI
jgi:hypothetical protein